MKATVQVVRSTAFACALSVSTFLAKAQSISTSDGKFEIGVGLGPMIFLGDLGGNKGVGSYFIKDVNLPLTKLSKGLFVNFYPAEWIGFRAAFNHSIVQGADSLIKDEGTEEVFRKQRNLHFRSPLTEVYGAVEISPTYFLETTEGLKGKIRPYGLIGIGITKFKPQAKYYSPNGSSRWVDLKPLHTEGQGMIEYPNRKEYKTSSLMIPMGGGIKWYVTDDMHIGFEILHRKTFTDYIDDVSTNYIDPQLFDKYLTPEQAVVARQVNNRFEGSLSQRPYGEGDERGKSKYDSYFSSVLRFGWRLYDNSTARGMSCPKW